MVNFVTIDGKKYLVDVGFGSTGLTHPKLLEHEVVSTNIAPSSVRLSRRNIADNSDGGQQLWCYDHRDDDKSEWNEVYCFTETEFLPGDFAILNYFTSTCRQSWFTYKLLCVKLIMDKNEELIGQLILMHEVKTKTRGETQILAQVETEDQRLAALEKYFGIYFTKEERDGIKGMASELVKGFSM